MGDGVMRNELMRDEERGMENQAQDTGGKDLIAPLPRCLIASLLFLLALLPRLVALDRFVTTDEPTWMGRSARFAEALLSGRLAGTFQSHHPGVTTMWTATLGLMGEHLRRGGSLAELLAVAGRGSPIDPGLLPAVRMGNVLLASLCVVMVYILARKLFGSWAALLGAGLVALDPFYLAHSRILHHDALATTFATVSVLSLTVYLWRDGRWPYLALSGGAAGLAWLSKVSALFLGPIGAAIIGLAWVAEAFSPSPDVNVRAERAKPGGLKTQPPKEALPSQPDDSSSGGPVLRPTSGKLAGGRYGRILVLWGLVAALTFVLFWPAMWVNPVGTLLGMLAGSSGQAGEGHLQFFRGVVSLDPGPWFYPVVFLFRASPLTLLGLALALVLAAGKTSEVSRDFGSLPLAALLLYAALFAFLISLTPKKQDRYLLPVFPVLDVVAAVGFVGAARLVGRRWIGYALVAGGVAVQAALALPYAPYYLGYYNPLVGGPRAALDTLRVGWGDGLDEAGRYLARKPGAGRMVVAAVPGQCLSPYFPGEVVYFYSNGPALSADYVVLYVNQVQRLAPSPEIVRFFQARPPEHVVHRDGIAYAWIYPGPKFVTPALPAVQQAVDFDLGMMGWRGFDAGTGTAGGVLPVTLYWRALGRMDADYAVSVRLVDEAGRRWAQRDGQPVFSLLPTGQWRPGTFVRDEYRLDLPPDVPPGDYRLQVVVYSPADGQPVAPPATAGTVKVE